LVAQAPVSMAYMEDLAMSYADTFGVVIPEVKSRLDKPRRDLRLSISINSGPMSCSTPVPRCR
jgi:hypothetical protein